MLRADDMAACGFKPPDARWETMKAVWDACKAADIEVPDEVSTFFGGKEPDLAGVQVSQTDLLDCGAIIDWYDKEFAQEGVDIIVDQIPADVKIIRIYNYC